MPRTGVNLWKNQKGYTGSDPHLQRQECAEVMRSYVKSKEHDTKVETAKRYLSLGKLSFEEIAIGSGLSLEEVEELADLQLV